MSSELGTTAHRVVQEIRRLVAAGELAQSGRLPPERKLADHFGVARNTVRQALAKMETDGMLLRQVGRGTFVKSEAGEGRGMALPGLWPLQDASPADLMEVRLILEPHAAAFAATRAEADDFTRLNAALNRSLKARRMEDFEKGDAEIHYTIFEATKNAVLMHYCLEINAIRKQPAWFQMKKRTLSPARRRLYDRQHRALVAAIVTRDPDAAYRLARAHALEVKANLESVRYLA